MAANRPVANVVGDDIYFQARIASVFERAGFSVHTVSSGALPQAAEADWGACVWVFDMNVGGEWARLLAAVRGKAPAALLVAFGSHKEKEAFQAARKAGADRILARSQFIELLPRLPEMAREGGCARKFNRPDSSRQSRESRPLIRQIG